MKKTAWIWFVGCVVWVADGFVSISYKHWLHARIAFTVALVFLAAGIFYRRQE